MSLLNLIGKLEGKYTVYTGLAWLACLLKAFFAELRAYNLAGFSSWLSAARAMLERAFGESAGAPRRQRSRFARGALAAARAEAHGELY